MAGGQEDQGQGFSEKFKNGVFERNESVIWAETGRKRVHAA